MKTLKEFLTEEITATPGNTMGMGNPMAPQTADGTDIGTEPLVTAKAKRECEDCKKKKKKKRRMMEER